MTQKCSAPPIPPNLALSSTLETLPDGKKRPKSLNFVRMLGVNQFNSGNWQNYIGKKGGPDDAQYVDVGYYTVGISTCVGIGMVFVQNDAAGQDRCQVSLAHLSNQVASNENMLTAITTYMAATNLQNPARRLVIAYEEGNPEIDKIWQTIARVFPRCGIPMDDTTVLVEELYPMMPARLAVNFYPQMGVWLD